MPLRVGVFRVQPSRVACARVDLRYLQRARKPRHPLPAASTSAAGWRSAGPAAPRTGRRVTLRQHSAVAVCSRQGF